MDIVDLIRQLRDEKARLDRTIAALEAIWASGNGSVVGKRRGRRAMPESERKDVSKRMREYWAAWRKARAQQGRRKQRPKGREEGDSLTDA